MHDVSKTIKMSNEQISLLVSLGKKYDMGDCEIMRLGLELIGELDRKGELLKMLAKLLEKRP